MDEQAENVEYSSRELKPNALLMRDLLRAHSVFLLHHASSLSALFVKARRSNFVKVLGRFWDAFLSTWDVMLHGNPSCNVFGGIKIAACGELGVGVGEENRGSGEREVLEGFVGRIEGLTDLVVSRFGSSEPTPEPEPGTAPTPWLGTGDEPGAEDGAIFLGVGALSRKSLRDITCWMEDIYSWGENAYGVKDSPTSTRHARKHRKVVPIATEESGNEPQPSDGTSTPRHSSSTPDVAPQMTKGSESTGSAQGEEMVDEGGMNRLMSYLKMGYGTHWGLGSSEDGAPASSPTKDDRQRKMSKSTLRNLSNLHEHFLIGLTGDMEEPDSDEGDRVTAASNRDEAAEYNSRILLRTLTVELDEDGERPEAQQVEDLGSQSTELVLTASGNKDPTNPESRFDSQDRNKTQKMRVVVYVTKPFMFTFLFRNRTDSLAWDGLYRSLHHQLAPLRKPLALSTAYRPDKPDVGEKSSSHIFDLVWDPKALTLHSTIPSIPTPAEMPRDDRVPPVWSRAEAVNTHNQILNTYAATVTDYSELERTCKTNRGWWVVWTRVLERDSPSQQPHNPNHPVSGSGSGSEHASVYEDTLISESTAATAAAATGAASTTWQQQQQVESPATDTNTSRSNSNTTPKPAVSKEIFLIRRAGEHAGTRGIAGSSYTESGGGGGGSSGGSGNWAEGASRLAQGIGVDTNKYIEGLLNMTR